ncbi:Hypothetical protein D9617_7g029710 [Elsinoe fawcettii]|nr:Hypothetical protein D9617_7g029710 [Elsinoe fawcettii]
MATPHRMRLCRQACVFFLLFLQVLAIPAASDLSSASPRRRDDQAAAPADAATLTPVAHPDVDFTSLDSLNPNQQGKIFFTDNTVHDDNTPKSAASVVVRFKFSAVILDNSDLVESVTCSASSISIKLKTKEAYTRAFSEWAKESKLVLLSGSAQCGMKDASTAFVATSFTFDEASQTAKADGSTSAIADVYDSFDLQLGSVTGQTNTTVADAPKKLRKRTFGFLSGLFSGYFGLGFGLGGGIPQYVPNPAPQPPATPPTYSGGSIPVVTIPINFVPPKYDADCPWQNGWKITTWTAVGAQYAGIIATAKVNLFLWIGDLFGKVSLDVPRVDVYCVDCNAKAQFTLSAQISSKAGQGVTQCVLNLGGKMSAGVHLGINAFVAHDLDYSQDLYVAGLPRLDIPGLITINPQLSIKAEGSIKIAKEGQFLAGGSFEWSTLSANFDLISHGQTGQSGFAPNVTKRVEAYGLVSAQTDLRMPISISFDVQVLGGLKLGSSLVHTPSISAGCESPLTPGFLSKTKFDLSSSGSCEGLEYGISASGSLDLGGASAAAAVSLYAGTWPLLGGCVEKRDYLDKARTATATIVTSSATSSQTGASTTAGSVGSTTSGSSSSSGVASSTMYSSSGVASSTLSSSSGSTTTTSSGQISSTMTSAAPSSSFSVSGSSSVSSYSSSTVSVRYQNTTRPLFSSTHRTRHHTSSNGGSSYPDISTTANGNVPGTTRGPDATSTVYAPGPSSPSGNTPSSDYPSGDIPIGNTPSEDTPGGNTPSGDTPSGDTPSGNTPTGNTPTSNTPSGNTPGGNMPSGNSPNGNNSPSGSTPGSNTTPSGSVYTTQPSSPQGTPDVPRVVTVTHRETSTVSITTTLTATIPCQNNPSSPQPTTDSGFRFCPTTAPVPTTVTVTIQTCASVPTTAGPNQSTTTASVTTSAFATLSTTVTTPGNGTISTASSTVTSNTVRTSQSSVSTGSTSSVPTTTTTRPGFIAGSSSASRTGNSSTSVSTGATTANGVPISSSSVKTSSATPTTAGPLSSTTPGGGATTSGGGTTSAGITTSGTAPAGYPQASTSAATTRNVYPGYRYGNQRRGMGRM